MCRVGEGLRSGSLPSVLFIDNTSSSFEMRAILDSAGAKYQVADAAAEGLSEPLLVVEGAFLDLASVKELLSLT